MNKQVVDSGKLQNAYVLVLKIDDSVKKSIDNFMQCDAEHKSEVLIMLDGQRYEMTLAEFVHRLVGQE